MSQTKKYKWTAEQIIEGLKSRRAKGLDLDLDGQKMQLPDNE